MVNVESYKDLDGLFLNRGNAVVLLCLGYALKRNGGRPLRRSALYRLIINEAGIYVSEGTVRRALPRLIRRKLVAVDSSDPRRAVYCLTPAGVRKADLLDVALAPAATRHQGGADGVAERARVAQQLDQLFQHRGDPLVLLYLRPDERESRALRVIDLNRMIIGGFGAYLPEGSLRRTLPRLVDGGLVAVDTTNPHQPAYSLSEMGMTGAELVDTALDSITAWRRRDQIENRTTGVDRRSLRASDGATQACAVPAPRRARPPVGRSPARVFRTPTPW